MINQYICILKILIQIENVFFRFTPTLTLGHISAVGPAYQISCEDVFFHKRLITYTFVPHDFRNSGENETTITLNI